jgi:hypothetical protein
MSVDTSAEAVEHRAKEAGTFARAIRETKPGEVRVSAEWFDATAATLLDLAAERDGTNDAFAGILEAKKEARKRLKEIEGTVAASLNVMREALAERDALAAENAGLREALTAISRRTIREPTDGGYRIVEAPEAIFVRAALKEPGHD